MGVWFRVEVNNVPDDCYEWIVARWSPASHDLWFWGSWKSEAQAKEIAKMIDGVVVRRVEK